VKIGASGVTEWILRHKETIGRHYTSELAGQKDRRSGCASS
jgi:hypothetical protein